MNLYGYVGNHPTLLVDPTGLRAQTKRLTGGLTAFDPEASLLASLDTSWLWRPEPERSVATILPETDETEKGTDGKGSGGLVSQTIVTGHFKTDQGWPLQN